jgi:hypothetical protein
MSTDYMPLQHLNFSEVFDGRLAQHGVRECISEKTSPTFRCLGDGENWLWCWGDTSHFAGCTVFAQRQNNGEKIMAIISRVFEVQFLSEHEPGFFEVFELQEQMMG